MRHVHADQSGMIGFTLHQRREIWHVVDHQDAPVIDRAANNGPVLVRAQSDPCDMRGLRETPCSGNRRQRGAQTLVNQELHSAASREVSVDSEGWCERQNGSRRGRPRGG